VGSARLVRSLLARDLVDALRMVFPVVLGGASACLQTVPT
jgi:hypothetical protein